MLQENCYVVSDETKECVIIDCGAYTEAEKLAIEKYINENELRPVHLIATHGHLDHNFGDAFITSTYGLPLELDASDEAYVRAADKQAALFGIALTEPRYRHQTVHSRCPPQVRLARHRGNRNTGTLYGQRSAVHQRRARGVHRRHSLPWLYRQNRLRGWKYADDYTESAHVRAVPRRHHVAAWTRTEDHNGI